MFSARTPSPAALDSRGPSEIEQRLDLRIAGINYVLLTRETGIWSAARARFADCLVADCSAPRLVTRIHQASDEDLYEGELARMTVRDDRVEVRSSTGLEGRVDLLAGEGQVRIGPRRIEGALENYLRMINAVLVLERGGIHLHSAGVVRQGKGYVFFGPPDAGKSTTAGFSAHYQVLSDDQNVLIPEEGGVTLWGVPFKSFMCPVPTSPGSAPVRRLLQLRQDTYDGLEDLSPAMAVAALASQCPFVNFQPDLAPVLLRNCERIVSSVPVQVMRFRRGPEFWKML